MLGIIDSFEIDGLVYIVTRYEAGGDLASYPELIGLEHLSEAQVFQIFI